MVRYAVVAEKKDIACKLALTLGPFRSGGREYHLDDFEAHKDKIEWQMTKDGVIERVYNGDTYRFVWASGHLISLQEGVDYDPDYAQWHKVPMPFFPNYQTKIISGSEYDKKTGKWKKLKTPDKRTKAMLKHIKEECSKADVVINGCDFDREGQLIFSYIMEYLKIKKNFVRIFLNEMTEEKIREALLKPFPASIDAEMAGRARAIADWAVGINLTIAATLTERKKTGQKVLRSIGRVQTPVFDMVVKRQKAIENFVPEPTYSLKSKFTSSDGVEYIGTHIATNNKPTKDKSMIEELLKKVSGHDGVIVNIDSKDFSKAPDLFYNTATLQSDAKSYCGFPIKETDELAEKLYQKGFITYPRTDATTMPSSMKPNLMKSLKMLQSSVEFGKFLPVGMSLLQRDLHYNDKEYGGEVSHTAIVTTAKPVDVSLLSSDELALYRLVAFSVIRSAYPDEKGTKSVLTTEVNGEQFTTTGVIVKEKGWTVLVRKKRDDVLLPDVKIGETVSSEPSIETGTTKPPAYYNETTLQAAMKTAGKLIDDKDLRKVLQNANKGGIGRPSTYADIIKRVVTQYCTVDKKGRIQAKPESIAFLDSFPVSELKSPALTASWEEKLNLIEEGKYPYDQFIAEVHAFVTEAVRKIQVA